RSPVVLLPAALAGSAIAVAGCGGDSESRSSAGDVASFVPSSSPLYLEVTTDFDGAQWQQAEGLAKQFPGYPKLGRAPPAGAVNFDRDIRPLLGERAALAGLELPDTAELQGELTTTAPDPDA